MSNKITAEQRRHWNRLLRTIRKKVERLNSLMEAAGKVSRIKLSLGKPVPPPAPAYYATPTDEFDGGENDFGQYHRANGDRIGSEHADGES